MRVEDHVVHALHANSLKQIVNCCRFDEHRTGGSKAGGSARGHHSDLWGWKRESDTAVYRKSKSERIDDEVRPLWRANL